MFEKMGRLFLLGVGGSAEIVYMRLMTLENLQVLKPTVRLKILLDHCTDK